MGVDTKILLTGAPDILEVLKFADRTWGNASLHPFGARVDAYWLFFKDGKDERQLSVFPPGECASDYADVCAAPAVYMSMGCWGNSEAIARRFAIAFGGMIMPNDSTDDWQNV
jgi:hypothetical protein